MSTCNDFDALHLASSGDPLGSADQATFDAHLAQCPSCVARLKNSVVVTEVLRRLEPLEGPDAVHATDIQLSEALVQRILTARRTAAQGNREQRRSG